MANRRAVISKGFTLIELIVVIALLGILATITIGLLNPLEQMKKGRDAKRRADLKTLQTVMEAYKIRVGTYVTATDFGPLISSGDIKTIPKDPKGTDYPKSLNASQYCICAQIERGTGDYCIPTGNSGSCVTTCGTKQYICVTQIQ